MSFVEITKRFFSDNSGNFSSLRVVFLLAGLTFIPAMVTVWTYVSFYNRAMSDIPGGVSELLGILLLGKALQKGVEVYGETKSKDSP